MKSVLFYILCSFLVSDHDVAIALFDIQKEDNSFIVEITVDQEDLITSLGISTVNKELLTEHLNVKSTWLFNGKKSELEIDQIKKKSDHFLLRGHFNSEAVHLESIQVLNHFMLDIENHSNIIRLNLDDNMRDFRMHKGRTEIAVEL